MKRKFDWFAFRNETAARVAANLSTDHQTSYSYQTEYLVRDSIELANKLTIKLMDMEDEDVVLKKLNKDKNFNTSRKRNGKS